MPGTKSLNLPDALEHTEAVYHSLAGRPAVWSLARARPAGHLSSLIRLILDEPEAMHHIQETARELRGFSGLDTLLPKLLDGALALTGADLGTVRLLDPISGALIAVTQRGFGPELTGYSPVVGPGDPVRERAAQDCAQTLIPDITVEPGCAPYREIAAAAGFRAVQSTWLADSDGKVIGMVSTHFRQPGPRPDRDLRMVELYCDLVGERVARHLRPAPGDAAVGIVGNFGSGPRYAPGDEPARPDAALAGFAGEIMQRLFAVGVNLASAQDVLGDGPAGDRVAASIDDLDGTIRDIQAAVFGLRGPQSVPRTNSGR